ncbi:hypothetical protein [Blautia sp. HCN-1074]|uniref:hypothetical protein n=1 Tax=Blautia sp. HCN-1074 TaxID=3134667 RepID=UPI0030BD4925
MQTVSSYGVEIRKQNIPIRQTLEIYRQAVSYLTEIYEQVWAELKMIPEAKKRFNAAEHLIHTTNRKGMRISRICAWNTSRLAYDGSGIVLRDWRNHSLCAFQTGKRYNCDLSASYNIGARYFIRELLKPLPATERSLLEAKVPAVKRRTSCVYADLRELSSEMGLLMAA